MSGQDDFRRALEGIKAAKRRELGEPPTPEELLAYRDGQLDAAGREVVEAKIAVYPEAARALADLAAFPEIEPEPGEPELSDEDLEARWQAVRPRLAARPQRSGPAEGLRPKPSRGGWSRFGQLAAAAVLVLAAGLTGYVAGRGSGTSPTSPTPGPSINVTIAELAPLEEGGMRSSPAVEMPPSSEELMLVLQLPDTGDLSGHTAEILDAQDTRLWSREGLRPTPLGTLHLSFPQGILAPGTYRIEIFGQQGGERTRVAIYELQMEEGAVE